MVDFFHFVLIIAKSQISYYRLIWWICGIRISLKSYWSY